MQEVLSLILLAGIPYLEARKSINDFVFQSRNQINFSGDTNIIEAVSYGHILAGEFQIAEKLLGKLSIELSHEVKNEPQILWLLEAQQRVQLVLQYLQERVPENAIKQLNEWEKFTLSKNGLVKKSINRQIDE
jgi:hypothetical protein